MKQDDWPALSPHGKMGVQVIDADKHAMTSRPAGAPASENPDHDQSDLLFLLLAASVTSFPLHPRGQPLWPLSASMHSR